MNKSIGSSKGQLTKLETIFNHNPTEKELRQLTGRVIDKEYYIKRFDEDYFFYDIYQLYLIRGNKKTAEKYYLMISEETRKKDEEYEKNRVSFGYKGSKNTKKNKPLLDDETLERTIKMALSKTD